MCDDALESSWRGQGNGLIDSEDLSLVLEGLWLFVIEPWPRLGDRVTSGNVRW